MPNSLPEFKSIAKTMRMAVDAWIAARKGWGNSVGLCIPAALALCEALGRLGYSSSVVRGHYQVGKVEPLGHAWVECDGMIIDLTADQFNLPTVHVTSVGDESYFAMAAGADSQFDRDMGPAGDTVLMTYRDKAGKEHPVGSSIDIRDDLISRYEKLRLVTVARERDTSL